MQYRIVIWQDGHGRDFARWGTLEISSTKGVSTVIARAMVGLEQIPDGPMAVHGQDGQLRFSVSSLYRHAGRVVAEGDREGPRWKRWHPKPREVFAPFPED